MSDPIVATLVVSSTLVYFLLVGVTFALMPKQHKDTGTAHIGAFLWPLCLPMMIGMWLVSWLTAPRATLPKATVRNILGDVEGPQS